MNKNTPSFHPKNAHQGQYDMERLCAVHPALNQHVFKNAYGTKTIKFADPEAVLTLNKALLKLHYGIEHWTIPQGFLCPPIPGRADYLHHLSDLIHAEKSTENVVLFDIGTGANCIYPLVGAKALNWSFIGSDVNEASVRNAENLVEQNGLSDQISIRHQQNVNSIFKGIVEQNERFDACICNPPFHQSKAEALRGTQRKNRNLTGNAKSNKLNFGGEPNELWCVGGEVAFIKKIISESSQFKHQFGWFTSLVSKADHLDELKKSAKKIGASEIVVVPMGQGNKVSRFIAWRFQ